jgi:hypothetical protein
MQAISVMISKSMVTQFSLNIFEWTGAVCTSESKRQLYKQFRWWFLSRRRLSFPWIFLSENGLCALTNHSLSSASSFGDDFFGMDSIFLDYFLVNKGCVRWRIHASALEAVSVMISDYTASQFSLTISESK